MTAAIYMAAIVAGIIALGAFLELCDVIIAKCLGPYGVVAKINLQQEEADDRRRRLELDAAAGRVR